MDVREKLVELLTDNLPRIGIFPKCDNPLQYTMDEIVERIADHLIANGVTIAKDNNVPSKWIPVTERLPECDQVVLCYKADRGVRTGKHLAATYADGVSAFKDCCRDYAFGATHWMPLPKPPKGE